MHVVSRGQCLDVEADLLFGPRRALELAVGARRPW